VQSESTDPNLPRAFRICQNCGQPTPAQLPQCVNCGARSIQNVVVEQQAKAERRFLNALFSRATPVTYAILIFNFVIYLLMALVSGENFLEAFVFMSERDTLIAFGAKTNELLAEGQWFRLITPIFIHGGLLHLASNSYAIWVIGPVAEKLYGSARYLLIYLLAGIGGVSGSFLGGLGYSPGIPSVGASGAIFGLFGLLFVFGYRYRSELPPNFRRAVTTGMLPVILINLFIGYTFPAIDNSAHIGGLLSGAILSFFIPYIAPGHARVSRFGLAILVGCIFVIAYSFARAYQTSGAHLGSGRGIVQFSTQRDKMTKVQSFVPLSLYPFVMKTVCL
jgi:rhomboid protease GluP